MVLRVPQGPSGPSTGPEKEETVCKHVMRWYRTLEQQESWTLPAHCKNTTIKTSLMAHTGKICDWKSSSLKTSEKKKIIST